MRNQRQSVSINCGPLGCLLLIVAFIFMVSGCNHFLAGLGL